MTVSVATSKVIFAPGAPTTGPFTFSFEIYDASDLRVIKRSTLGVDTVLTLNTDYTVSVGPWPSGGTVTTTANVAVGEKLLIKLSLAATQGKDLPTNGIFPAADVEQALDRNTKLVQQVIESMSRGLQLQETSAISPIFLADPSAAGDILVFNGSSFGFGQASSLSPSTIVVTAAGQALITGANAAAQRVTLGVEASVYLTGVAGTNTITATAPTGITSLQVGQTYKFIVAGTNTGAVTLAVGSFGAKAITMKGSVSLKGRELIAGDIVEVTYDGTRFQLGTIDFSRTCNLSVYLTANQSITTTPTEIGSGGMTYQARFDPWGDMDLGTGRFLCPADGLYQVNFFAELETQLASVTQRFTTYFANETFSAGNIDINGSTANSSGSTGPIVIISAGGGLVSLTKGQYRSMWLFHDNAAGATRILDGVTIDSTGLQIRRVG